MAEEKKYHGRGEFLDCSNSFAVNTERFASEEECDHAIHPADRRRGARPRKCRECRGWYISAEG